MTPALARWRRDRRRVGGAIGGALVARSAPLATLALLATSALLATLAALALLAPVVARADFTGATLLSGTSEFQFEEAREPALSADGRYVVFTGSLAGAAGIYRRDLQSGAVELVVGASGEALGAGAPRAPSISEEGRYVAFTSSADLDPKAEPEVDKGCSEVYVRDMSVSSEEAAEDPEAAYKLASALDGSTEGITFAGCADAGAQSSPGVALSAEGQQVVFTVLSSSNLDGSCTTTPALACTTPPSQVAVRDLQMHTTTLVSVTPAGEPTPGGGAYPSVESGLHESDTAAISADATTVAWFGSDVGAQVPTAKGEIEAGIKAGEGLEAEPLWRRIADGPAAVTRRLLNGAGLNFFFPRVKEGAILLGGSFVDYSGDLPGSLLRLALSEHGQTVAVLSNAPPPASEASALLEGAVNAPNTDAYVVHVSDNPETAPQVIALTTTPDYVPTRAPTTGEVENIAISPNGSRVAFDTSRTQFALPALTLISPPTTYTGTSETYEANLQTGTLQLVTSTYDGAEPNGSAAGLSFSKEGQRLAFASAASNLFYGDGLPRTSEVYLAEEIPTEAHAAVQEIGPTVSPALPTAEWLLSAVATAAPDGSVLITAQVPGAGTLAANAEAQLAASPPEAGGARSRRAAAGHAKRTPPTGARSMRASAKRAPAKAAHRSAALLTRMVAHAETHSTAPAQIELRLRVKAPYSSLVRGADGLYAVLSVTFTAPGRATLTREIPITFHQRLRKPGADRRAGAAQPRHGSARRRSRTRSDRGHARRASRTPRVRSQG